MNTKGRTKYKHIVLELVEDIKHNPKSMRVKQGQLFRFTGSISYLKNPYRFKSKNKVYTKINAIKITTYVSEIILIHIYQYLMYGLVLCEHNRESQSFIDESQIIELNHFKSFCLYYGIELSINDGGIFLYDFCR